MCSLPPQQSFLEDFCLLRSRQGNQLLSWRSLTHTPHCPCRLLPPPFHAAPDVYGPRFGIGICIGLTAPAVYCIGLCTNAAGFIVSRLFIGFSLATFVACQFWCTSMFNTKVVGTANALAAGWVSLCGGRGGGWQSQLVVLKHNHLVGCARCWCFKMAPFLTAV